MAVSAAPPFLSRRSRDLYQVVYDLIPDRKQGGRLVFVTGKQGAGKTTLLAHITHLLHKHGVQIFWRGRAKGHVFQFLRIPIVVLIHRELDVRPFAVYETHFKPLSWQDLGIVHVDNFADPIELEDLGVTYRGHALVIFMPRDAWIDWLTILADERKYAYWMGVFIDEFGQIAPEHPKGKELWQRLNDMADSIAEFRKNDIYLIVASQQPSDVFWKIRKKFQYRAVLPGTQVEDALRLSQKAVDNLTLGFGYMVSGFFQLFKFPEIEPKLPFDIKIRASGTKVRF